MSKITKKLMIIKRTELRERYCHRFDVRLITESKIIVSKYTSRILRKFSTLSRV